MWLVLRIWISYLAGSFHFVLWLYLPGQFKFGLRVRTVILCILLWQERLEGFMRSIDTK